MKFKDFIEQNNISPDRALRIIVGQGGEILPQKIGMQGYFGEVTDTGILFSNDKLNVEKKEVPFSSFTRAEFGLGSAQLWLQCTVDGSDFVFCLPRSVYKSAAGQYLLDQLDAQLGESLREDPEYKKHMGPLFWLYAIIHAW